LRRAIRSSMVNFRLMRNIACTLYVEANVEREVFSS
jgi:hypothetical protein